MVEHWLLLNSGPCAADFNMAFDEALLEFAAHGGAPVLRFYGWTERAASFGYFQKCSDVERLTSLRPLVRRPTGGGLVPHDADWTYSLVFPRDHWWHASRAQESYRRTHEWIRDAFAKLGLVAELSPSRRVGAAGQCFVGAEQFDVLWQGRKIAGAAQRRNRLGLLIQGSVQPPPIPLAKADWQAAMCDVAFERWNVRWSPFGQDSSSIQRAEQLAREKYSRDAYTRRR
ncbi:MAG TPA: lipoate--protein ligase family protein [Candidatus Angelobacter sp.]|nr:lipoate--protein ligase family protein [Candidatus Angelobacter sp.]